MISQLLWGTSPHRTRARERREERERTEEEAETLTIVRE